MMLGNNLQAILWDFDGVLINSNHVRNLGFELVLEHFPKHQLAELMSYHKLNGGLSRYAKFRYFFEVIRSEPISDQQVLELAQRFSKIMMKNLCDESLLIEETLSFVKRKARELDMFIVSGSDQNELRELCKYFNLSEYFKGIFGSPVTKNELVANILQEYKFRADRCLLIGDSINDYNAARVNGLQFMAYNNDELNGYSTFKIPF